MVMFYALTQTVQLISHFRYWLLFPAVIIEGPIATIIAGLLSVHGELNFFVSYLVVVVADTAADLGYYALGAFGESRVSQRLRSRLGITSSHIAKLQNGFSLHSWKVFLVGKVLHGPGITVLVAAGAARVPLLKFLSLNFAITVVKSFALLLIGYYFGQALSLFQRYLDVSALLTSGVVIIFGIAFFIKYRARKKRL